ncbi:MAG TPA: heparinase II/III family protein [Opitutaceae bacterium]|nr:heparinase II/III family protein [Opitutaceae bacterium]
MNKLPFAFLLAPFFLVSAHAEYSIGQKAIPEVTIQSDAAKFEVYAGHPRLFFRDTDLPVIRERIRGEYRAEWEDLLARLQKVIVRPPADLAKFPYVKEWAIPRSVLFAAVVTGDEQYVKWSKEWAAALAAAGPVGPDAEYRGRLQCLAIAYDWLYPALSPAERQTLTDAILAHIDRAWHFAAEANYIGNHSRWGNFTLAAGLLALITDHPELRDKLLQVRAHWIDGYFPAQGWIAQDGGYHMGWAYSAAYLTGSIHNVWSTATNECVFFPWQAKLPLFWIYGRQGDGTYPNTGDAYTVVDDLNGYYADLLMIAAGVLKEPHAAWMVSRRADPFAVILYGDKSVRPLAPDDANAPLELSRHFRNAGVVIARDHWNDKTTLLQFSSPSFYSTNHQHRDANAFTLHYGGGLAIDSGLYDEGKPKEGGYNGVHWRNYFTRTVAHNAILVFDPKQEMTVIDEPASNDGGQVFRRDPTTLKDILPGGHAHLDGITHYVNTADYTYASGDATKAYDAERVRLAQRELVYLRNSGRAHPVVVVFDRVESAKPEFQKRFLLHTVNEPVVNETVTVAENRGGRLSCVTLLPEKATLELIGGPGKEAWVNGKNYPWSTATRKKPGREPGAWRLEVSPSAPHLRDYFLNVLFVDDVGAKPVSATDATLTKTADSATVRVGEWQITFPFEAGGAARIERAR